MTQMFRVIARKGLTLATLAASATLFAACSASHDVGSEDEPSSGAGKALIRCSTGQHSECSHEGMGGKLICSCEENDRPPPPPPPAPPGTLDRCVTDPRPDPSTLPTGCQHGLWVNGAEFCLCAAGTPLPAFLYGPADARGYQLMAWIATSNPSSTPRCTSNSVGLDSLLGDYCYFDPKDIARSCLAAPPPGYFYMVESSDSHHGPIGGGCHGPCELSGP